MLYADVRTKVQISGQSAELERRSTQVRDRGNRNIVRAGQSAVENGLVTGETIGDVTGKTISRHLTMLRELGYREAEKADPHSFMEVVSARRVRVASGLTAILRQHPDNQFVSRAMEEAVADSGLEAALAFHASPRTTEIIFVGTKPSAFTVVKFGPTGFGDSDGAFREEWGRSFFASHGGFSSQAAREAMPADSPPMSGHDLVVTAGLTVVFNKLLDRVEAGM